MSQERLKILEMLQEGKIDAAEAEKLLASVDSNNSNSPAVRKTEGPFKMIRVKVLSEQGDKVNVQVPLSLVRAALNIGKGFMKHVKIGDSDQNLDFDAMGIDFEEIIKLAEEGALGKLVDIETANGDLVEVYVE